ncbi:MAG: hypothetical protein A3K19_22990 [Lentisphaerae bacterium RIFOXYB12_FULL_65_16]|nr:MAG: hypothetical protein A3K18_16765 [Lentisphaerae bacterium RIFOXYA12_64_32]OGV90076.1 MAG: hypothetical protein A3K19_22990 [Lentisphaerae bacterium RIFOXYB12_FULL_65_16]
MRFDELLNELASGLAGNRIHALLAGGWALSAYGVSRQTVDVDSADFKELCQRYGSEEIYQEIRSHRRG